MKEIIATDRAPRAIGPYSQAVRAGGFIYASGQIPLDPLTGEFVSADEHGVLLKLGDNKYSERIPWSRFSQSDLKDIGQKNPKAAQFIEPFIELTPDEKIREGFRLYEDFCQTIRHKVRVHFPEATDEQVEGIVIRVLAFQSRREENRTYRPLIAP